MGLKRYPVFEFQLKTCLKRLNNFEKIISSFMVLWSKNSNILRHHANSLLLISINVEKNVNNLLFQLYLSVDKKDSTCSLYVYSINDLQNKFNNN